MIGILKELGFLNADGAPQDRYYRFLDRSASGKVLAEGVREAYSDLFAVSTSAHELNVDDAFNKLKTLYKGEKKDTVIKHIAKTFKALCDYSDFSSPSRSSAEEEQQKEEVESPDKPNEEDSDAGRKIGVGGLQYHINIIMPDTRDQAVYDALFKSMRDHLG